MVVASDFVSADVLVRLSRKVFMLILQHNIYRIKLSLTLKVLLNTKSPVFSCCRSRSANREKARQFWASGNERAAIECYQKGLEATPAMAVAFIEVIP